jgi:tetratricopeptide (TPR) repeat protein
VASEPEAVDDIIACCARLPLALTIAAARAATSPSFPLAVFAAELREAARALDPFHGGDSGTDVRAVFSWSYRALSTEAARLFRLLGLHPGPDVSIAAAASLAAIAPDRARVPLAELTRAHLLAEHSPGRYAFHDLLRAYAIEHAHAIDGQDVREAGVHRVLDHYLHTAHRAAQLIEPHIDPLVLASPQPGVTLVELATAQNAMAWFTAEHAAVLAAVQLAAETDSGRRAWQLAWAVSTFLLRRGSSEDNALAQQLGLEMARRLGDVAGEAHALHGLALGYARSGRFSDARPYLEQALAKFEIISDNVGLGRVHNTLTWFAEREQRPADALDHAMRALAFYRAAGHRPGQAMILNDVGFCQAQLGNYQEAIAYCEQGLAAVRELRERNWEAATWDSLGYIHHHLRDFDRAFACYEQAIELYRDLADRFNEADTLDHLADTQLSAGQIDAARLTWAQALQIFDEIDHLDGDQVRAKLGGLDHQPDRGGEAAAPSGD